MAESVRFNDYGWFTPADLSRVIDAIHALPDWKSVVLVGGQSLTAWVGYYKIKLPTLEGPYLTIDADFLGTKTEAEVIAKELGSNARLHGRKRQEIKPVHESSAAHREAPQDGHHSGAGCMHGR